MEFIKIEIIISNAFLQGLIERLEQAEVHGYTAIDIFRGKGAKRGEQLSEGLLPTTRSSLVFTVNPVGNSQHVLDSIESYIAQRSGLIITTKVEFASGLS